MEDNKKLTREWLIKFGFEEMPHPTISGELTIGIGRSRYISIGCVGTPNEMIFLGERNSERPTDLVVLRNYDYDGVTTEEQLKQIYVALTLPKNENRY